MVIMSLQCINHEDDNTIKTEMNGFISKVQFK